MIDRSKKGELKINGRKHKARIFTVKDKEIELYKIGALAAALNRTPQSLELWEKAGDMPHPMYKITHKEVVLCPNCNRIMVEEAPKKPED